MGIAGTIDKQLVPWCSSWDTSIVDSTTKVLDPMATVLEGYYQEIKKYCHRFVADFQIC